MELEFKGNRIVFQKELSDLDHLVLGFVEILEKLRLEYVCISGFVAIVFGRSRHTEDIDLFISPISLKQFERLWNELKSNHFECLQESSAKNAFQDYLKHELAVRFAPVGTVIPNFEVKFPSSALSRHALSTKVELVLNGKKLWISQIELQIAVKLSLGSEKDFEDARHLYHIFKDQLNIILLKDYITQLKVEKVARELLWPEKH